MKEKHRIVYTTEKPDVFGILEGDGVQSFVKEEVDRMTTESKRGKSVRPPTLRMRRIRRGEVIRMSPELSKQPGFRVFRAVWANPGSNKKEIAKVTGMSESNVSFHLSQLQKSFPGIFIMEHSKGSDYRYLILKPKELVGLSDEALFTKMRKPIERDRKVPTQEPKNLPEVAPEPAPQIHPVSKGREVPSTTTIPQSVLSMVKTMTISITDQGVAINLEFKE